MHNFSTKKSFLLLIFFLLSVDVSFGQLPEEGKGEDVWALENAIYHALLIYVDTYSDKKISPLPYTKSEVRQLERLLSKKYTFEPDNINVLENPDRETLIRALESLRSLSVDDNVLIYYAGHGHMDVRSEQGYWWPRNASEESRSNWISNGDIQDLIKGLRTRHTLLISDACFSGSIINTRGSSIDDKFSAASKYSLTSRKAMTSGAIEMVPAKSVFSQYLIKRLNQNTEPYLSAEQLYTSMRDAVISNSRGNVPQYGAVFNTGDEGGEFIFSLKEPVKKPSGRTQAANNSENKGQSISRELAYAMAIFSAIAQISQTISTELQSKDEVFTDTTTIRIGAYKPTFKQHITAKTDVVFKDVINVIVEQTSIKQELELEQDVALEQIFTQVIRLNFLRDMGARNLPEYLEFRTKEIDEMSGSKLERWFLPDPNAFSLSELLIEMNAAGFVVKDVEELDWGYLRVTVYNEEYDYEGIAVANPDRSFLILE